MREIKFRAWDKKNKHMWGSKDIGMWNNRIYFDSELPCGEQDLTPMQYTGLSNKKGVEIYEGDIVKWDYDNGDGTFDRRIDEVKFVTGCFIPDHWRTTVDNTEVIGNIYENPELNVAQIVVKRH